MKTKRNLKSMTLIALLGAALAAPVIAHPGRGMGMGMGHGMGMGMGPGMANGMGMGPGAGGGRGMMFDQNGGWSLMTPEERTAFQVQMRGVKTADECKRLHTEHRSAMEARAKEKGVTLPTPRVNPCERLVARGLIK